MVLPSSFQATLLIDGYNIIGAWPALEQMRDLEGLEEARHCLVEQLTNYSAYHGYNTRIIFDAQYQRTVSTRQVITSLLSVHYTDFGQTADTYIEKYCAAYCRNLPTRQERLIVATSDRAQQLMVIGYGAEWMSAQQLCREVEDSARRIRSRSRANKKQSSKRFLACSLDPGAQAQLAKLRFGLRPDYQD